MFTPNQIEGFLNNPDEEHRICIPILLRPEVIETTYNKLHKLQELLANSSSVTHFDLLQTLEPDLTQFYKYGHFWLDM